MKKDLSFVCNFLKALIIPNMPDDFIVAKPFRHGLTDAEIRKGITAFREFLYALFDKLSADKDKIDAKTGSNYDPFGTYNGSGDIGRCFPSIFDLALILFSLGIHSRLETKPKKRLIIHSKDLPIVIGPHGEKHYSLKNITHERKLEMFRLLSELGLCFNGTELSGIIDFSKDTIFHLTSKTDEFMIVGLKLIAESTANTKDYYYIFNMLYPAFLRCDFHPLANAVPKKHTVNIIDYANAHHPEIKKWIMETNSFLTNNDCAITHGLGSGSEFTYTHKKSKRWICRIYMGFTGCYITPGVNHLKNQDSIISMLPSDMVDIMKSGKGGTKFSIEQCQRRCGNVAFKRFTFTHNGEEFEGCQYAAFMNCQFAGEKCRFTGLKFALDTPINRKLMKKWIEMELAQALK
ncbi:MAG: hypothetical protein LBI04_10120 [Treponema sp.]|jgi:hypothetical protein|nr:hypothetical protein [Treponema sp.]